jgi:hypothetical protein
MHGSHSGAWSLLEPWVFESPRLPIRRSRVPARVPGGLLGLLGFFQCYLSLLKSLAMRLWPPLRSMHDT